MSTQIQLSIIIPVYNVEEYIEACLDSIITQISDTFLIEIIVVNDGSPDNSVSIVKRIQGLYQNIIRLVNQDNQGLSIARNNGLKEAKGNYVWFVDSDDYLLPHALNDVKSYIEAYPDVEVFSSFLWRFSENGKITSKSRKKREKLMSGKDYLYEKMPIGASPRFIISRDFLLKNNLHFLPYRLHEDAIFGYEMLYQVNKICIMDNPIYAYRIRTSGSIMSSIKIKTAYDLIFGHRYLCEFAKHSVKEEDKDKYREAIFGLILTLLDFCKNLYGTREYIEFLNHDDNALYIAEEAKFVFKKSKTNIKALLIAINPVCFIGALKVRKNLLNLFK